MSGIWLIARRDFSAFVNTLWGWVILSLALLIDGLLFNAFALTSTARYSAEILTDFFLITGGVALFAAVAITMRLFAEERQTGTIVLLESSPLSEVQSVLGKYLSGLMFLGLFLALTSFLPAMVMVNGKVSAEAIGVGYLGLFLLGCAALAIGLFGSALAKSQVVAALAATAITVGPATGSGDQRRCAASQTMPPQATRSSTALAKAA